MYPTKLQIYSPPTVDKVTVDKMSLDLMACYQQNLKNRKLQVKIVLDIGLSNDPPTKENPYKSFYTQGPILQTFYAVIS